MSCTRPQLRSESGQALVEFALVLPILLVLVFGILDFGKAFNYWIDTTHLANTGARFAVVNKNPGPEPTLQEYIRAQADTDELRNGGGSSVASALGVYICFPNGTSNVGDPVRVIVSTTYDFLPFLDSSLGITTVPIKGSATMRLEARPSDFTADGPCP
jgi:Flp pilus assembly protein TadG